MSIKTIFAKIKNFFRKNKSQDYDDFKTERRKADKRSRLDGERNVRMQQALNNNPQIQTARAL